MVSFGGGVRGFIRGHASFYSGGTCVVLFGGGMYGFIWGGMRGFIRGACVVFPVFSDTMRYGQ